LPELPDVETMRRYLQATSLHQEIEGVRVDGGQLLQATPPETLQEELVGRSFASTQRHGKYMFVRLDGGGDDLLVLHFGMTGGLTYFKDREDEPAYCRVLFHFANGYHLAYVSMRKLGEVGITDDVDRFVDERELGPDALAEDFDLRAFKNLVEGRRVMAKSFFMDQHTIAGVGNVYADEILFQAGIHPRTKMSSLDDETVEDLFHSMKDVLQEAIEHQAHPDRFPDSFIVPRRGQGGRCPKCGAELERVKVSSRSSYYCPKHQQQDGE